MPEWTCAYCGITNAQRTREHLFPAGMHRRLKAGSDISKKQIWLSKAGKILESEPTIGDVCSDCNNGFLSDLDNYACELFDAYCQRTWQRDETLRFHYDHHLLKRWLLKTSYNAARIHGSKDLRVYSALLPYVRGETIGVGRSVKVFLQVAYPGVIPQHERRQLGEDSPEIWEPKLNRVGFGLVGVEGGRKMLRLIHLRSLVFYVAFFDPTEGAASSREFTEFFLKGTRNAVELMASRSQVSVSCFGLDAWRSYQDADLADYQGR